MYTHMSIHTCGSTQPLGSFQINTSRGTGNTTNRAVHTGLPSLSVPKWHTNPLPKPIRSAHTIQECYCLGSTGSLSQKPGRGTWVIQLTCSETHQPVCKSICNSVTTQIKWLPPASCLSWGLQLPPSDLEYTWNMKGVFSPFNFANCLLLQNPSKACQSDAADDKDYPSRAPLPLPELMWPI